MFYVFIVLKKLKDSLETETDEVKNNNKSRIKSRNFGF